MIWPAIVGRLGANVARRWTLSAHTRLAGLADYTSTKSALVTASLACQNKNLATSDNYFRFKRLPE